MERLVVGLNDTMSPARVLFRGWVANSARCFPPNARAGSYGPVHFPPEVRTGPTLFAAIIFPLLQF